MVIPTDPPETDLGSELYKSSREESGRHFRMPTELRADDPAMLSVRGQPAQPSPSYIKKNFPDIPAAQGLWTPLYPQAGGPAQGFRCNQKNYPFSTDDFIRCGRVTRTERGMKLHLWRVHQIKQQKELKFD